MNEVLVTSHGSIRSPGDNGSVSGVIARLVKENTIAATYDVDGVELTAEIIPDADTLAQVMTREEAKTHAWRLPFVRDRVMVKLRILRGAKLNTIDAEIKDNLIERPGANRTVANSSAEKQTLRDLPTSMATALDAMTNTDDMEAYIPEELA